MQKTNSVSQADLLVTRGYFIAVDSDNPEARIRQQIDDELNRRVRDALETPPLERLRRRQLQNQAKA